MAKKFSSVGELETYLMNTINNTMKTTMETEVLEHVEDVLKKYVQTEVYDKSKLKPNAWVGGKTYERRYALFNSPMWHETESNSHGNIGTYKLRATSTADAGPSILGYPIGGENGWFLGMLEEGNLGFYDPSFPRPVIPVAQEFLDNDSTVKKIVIDGLSRALK